MQEDLNNLGQIDKDIALHEAALSPAALDHPGTDLAGYRDLLDAIKKRLEVIDGNAGTPAERADVLAEVLAGELGFAGDADA